MILSRARHFREFMGCACVAYRRAADSAEALATKLEATGSLMPPAEACRMLADLYRTTADLIDQEEMPPDPGSVPRKALARG